MASDKVFPIMLTVSALIHAGIFMQQARLNLEASKHKEQQIEVSYLKTNISAEEAKILKQTQTKKEKLPHPPSEMDALKSNPPPFIDKEGLFKRDNAIPLQKPALSKQTIIRPVMIQSQKKIILPQIDIDIDKISNPSYMDYYHLVREKIRRAAYQNYTRSDTGNVCLSFVISSDGTLAESRLIQEKSSPIPYLQSIALQSIREAAPFPPFPKELNYAQLPFSVVISFEFETD